MYQYTGIQQLRQHYGQHIARIVREYRRAYPKISAEVIENAILLIVEGNGDFNTFAIRRGL